LYIKVSAISGGILQELANILNNPKAIVDLLANSLPAQVRLPTLLVVALR